MIPQERQNAEHPGLDPARLRTQIRRLWRKGYITLSQITDNPEIR